MIRWALPRAAAVRAFAVFFVAIAAILPYLGSIDNYFVQDDFGVVWLLGQKPWWYFPRWFTSTWMDNIWGYTPDEIRPFPAVTYQVAAALTPGSPVADHVINIALHAGNGLLVLLLARRLVRLPLAAATVSALTFVVLPMHAESVAWVTGRVDSMPAFFYLASFIAYGCWRAEPSASHRYWASVALFFVALFSKQNALTLGPALVVYDLVVERRRIAFTREWIRPYVPFATLTLAYLGLRYALFGEVARESQLTASNVALFGELIVRHAQRTVFGAVGAGSVWRWMLVAAVLVFVTMHVPRRAIFFGWFWWALGVAPVLVAAYESPRHVYLASVGWAVLVGLAFDRVRQQRPVGRVAALIAAPLVIGAYGEQLVTAAEEWERRSAVSARAVANLEREALSAPRGSIVLAAAPVSSWEWAAPFVLRPPFVSEQVAARVTLITPWLIDCCRAQWEAETRGRLHEWLARGGPGTVLALRWDEQPERAFRHSSLDEPYLRTLIPVLLETDSRGTLDRAIRGVLDSIPPAGR
jgi:hypothetical protein